MSFTTPCFIRKNTPQLRECLKQLGYKLCKCTDPGKAYGDGWLFTTSVSVHIICHGAKHIVMDEIKEGISKMIDCGYNEDLFIVLASMRDDTNNMQLFTNGKDWALYVDDEDRGGLAGFEFNYLPKDSDTKNYHKATAGEIVENFKR